MAAKLHSIMHSVLDFVYPPINTMTGAVYTSPFLLSPDLIQRDNTFKQQYLPKTQQMAPSHTLYTPSFPIDNPLDPQNDWSQGETTNDHSTFTSDTELSDHHSHHFLAKTAPPQSALPQTLQLNAIPQQPARVAQLAPPYAFNNIHNFHQLPQTSHLPEIQFVKKGTIEFEIFLDIQEQKIEQRRDEYVALAKRSAKSLGHDESHLGLFDQAPTKEIIKYLDYHGEFIEELCEDPPEYLAVHFYIPNDDGTIPTEFYYDKIEPKLFHKLIQPELPEELQEELKKTNEHLEQLEREEKRRREFMLHPERFMVINEQNWEEWLPKVVDRNIFPDVDALKAQINSILRDLKKIDNFSDHVREVQKTTPMFTLVEENPTGHEVEDYHVAIHPYFWHPAVEPIWDADEMHQTDFIPGDPESLEAAEKVIERLQKYDRGEYTDETYPETDPSFFLREAIREVSGEMPIFNREFIESNNEIYDAVGDDLNNPEFFQDPYWTGTISPPSLELLHEEVSTDPFYRELAQKVGLSAEYFDSVVADQAGVLKHGWEYWYPEARAVSLADDEHIRKMWVDFDEDYLDEQFNNIHRGNEHLYRDRQAEDEERRDMIAKQRQELEDWLSAYDPKLYKQWIRHLYDHFHALHYTESTRSVDEINPEENPYYGDEARQVRELYFHDLNLDWNRTSDSLKLFRPPDGDLGDYADDPRWLEYYHLDPITGESLIDSTGRVLTAKEFREKKRQKELEEEEFDRLHAKDEPVSEQSASIFGWFRQAFFGESDSGQSKSTTSQRPETHDLGEDGKDAKTTSTSSKVPSRYYRLNDNELMNPEFIKEHKKATMDRAEAIRRARIDIHNDFLLSQQGEDEFDLLITSDMLQLPKEEPPPLDMPDLHIDTIRRKVAILNGDIEEDEEDNPLAADFEWADPDNIRIESQRMREITKYHYDKLDEQYVRKEQASKERFGDGLEHLEHLHLIGDRYDRREDNLFQRVEKTSAKFRQLDKDVQKLQALRDELKQYKTQSVFKKDFSKQEEVLELEKTINILSAQLKERFQDEELEYSRLEWDGIKDRVEFINDKSTQAADYRLKQLHRQKYIHVDYENNPEEGENFRDAYIRERIEQEQKKLKEKINMTLQKDPSLLNPIHIKNKGDINKLTMLLHREFGNDPIRLNEAIARLPIVFHTQDPTNLVDQEIKNAMLNPKWTESDLQNYGAVDKELLTNIITQMKNPDVDYDVIQARRHAKDYQEISNLLQSNLLPSTIQSRIDDLARTQSDLPLLQQIRDNPGLVKDVDTRQLYQLESAKSQQEEALKRELQAYQQDYLRISDGAAISDNYNQAYHASPPKTQKELPQFQIITPSQSTPWKSWNQKLEHEGFVEPGENEREMRQENLKNNIKRLFPAFRDEYDKLSPADKKFIDSMDDDLETVRMKMLDDIIDPDAPEPLRKQRLHEVEVLKKLTGIDILTPGEDGEMGPDGILRSTRSTFDFFHPAFALRMLNSPTKNRIFGKSFKDPQNEIDYRYWLYNDGNHLNPNRIHAKGNIFDRMMIPFPKDLEKYGDIDYNEIKDLMWSEKDVGAERIRKAPHRVWHIAKTQHQRLYDMLGDLKTQTAPKTLVENSIIDTLGKTTPMKSQDDAQKFYDEYEISQDVVPVHFIDSYTQLRPKQSHLEDEIEHYRRAKIEEYYRQRADSTFNYYNEDKLVKDKRVFAKKTEFEGKMRQGYFDEQAIKLGIFGVESDPDRIDELEREAMLERGDMESFERYFNPQSNEDDPTKRLRFVHPDIDLQDYKEYELFGPPSNTPSLFDKVKDHKRFVEDDDDYIFDQPITIKDKKTGKVLVHDDPINNIDIPGVELRRYNPAFKGDLDKLTKHDFAARDKYAEADPVYERYREQQYDRWRANLLDRGQLAEMHNQASPKLPKATYMVRKQAAEDLYLADKKAKAVGRELGRMHEKWAKDELLPEQIEEFRTLFHGTEKRAYFEDAIPHTDGDWNEDPYYDQSKTELDLPSLEFINQNPQFMKPRHALHKAKPVHTPIPRPKTYAAHMYKERDPLYQPYTPEEIQREEAWFKKDQDRIKRSEQEVLKNFVQNKMYENKAIYDQVPKGARRARQRSNRTQGWNNHLRGADDDADDEGY